MPHEVAKNVKCAYQASELYRIEKGKEVATIRVLLRMYDLPSS